MLFLPPSDAKLACPRADCSIYEARPGHRRRLRGSRAAVTVDRTTEKGVSRGRTAKGELLCWFACLDPLSCCCCCCCCQLPASLPATSLRFVSARLIAGRNRWKAEVCLLEEVLPHGRTEVILVAMDCVNTTTWQKAPHTYTSASYPFHC